MSIHPGYSGQKFMPEAIGAHPHAARARCRQDIFIQVDGGVGPDNVRELYHAGREPARRGHEHLRHGGSAARRTGAWYQALTHDDARARSSSPSAGAERRTRTRSSAPSSSRDGEVVGEGWHERRGEPHAEVNALRAAGERARGATMYVTLEPCAHHGSTPPCADAILEAGIARVVVGVRDPNPNVSGGGVERLREAGVDVEVVDGEPAVARAQSQRGLAVRARARAAVGDLQGRGHARRPDDGARRALGHGRGGAAPRARAARLGRRGRRRHGHRPRGRAAARRARTSTRRSSRAGSRSAAARCRTAPSSSCAPARSTTSCARSQHEGVQTLLLEGGPTLATAFLAADLVDKLLVFVAPTLGRRRRALAATLPNRSGCSASARAGRRRRAPRGVRPRALERRASCALSAGCTNRHKVGSEVRAVRGTLPDPSSRPWEGGAGDGSRRHVPSDVRQV